MKHRSPTAGESFDRQEPLLACGVDCPLVAGREAVLAAECNDRRGLVDSKRWRQVASGDRPQDRMRHGGVEAGIIWPRFIGDVQVGHGNQILLDDVPNE